MKGSTSFPASGTLKQVGLVMLGGLLGSLATQSLFRGSPSNSASAERGLWKRETTDAQTKEAVVPVVDDEDDDSDAVTLQASGPHGVTWTHGRHPGPVHDILYRQDYLLSYNRQTRNAHWTFEHLTRDHGTPHQSREGFSFHVDHEIPRMFRATSDDFTKSGFDRGHMVPCADITSSEHSMRETFLYSNISPQVPGGFNRGYWFFLEEFVRNLRKKFDHVYVYTGPLFLPEKDENGHWQMKYRILGDNQPTVSVPTHFFKVIMAENDGPKSRKKGAPPKMALGGFVLPNSRIPKDEPLESFIFPISEIARVSGLQFFPDVKLLAKIPDLCRAVVCDFHTQFWKSVEANDAGSKVAAPSKSTTSSQSRNIPALSPKVRVPRRKKVTEADLNEVDKNEVVDVEAETLDNEAESKERRDELGDDEAESKPRKIAPPPKLPAPSVLSDHGKPGTSKVSLADRAANLFRLKAKYVEGKGETSPTDSDSESSKDSSA